MKCQECEDEDAHFMCKTCNDKLCDKCAVEEHVCFLGKELEDFFKSYTEIHSDDYEIW